MTSSFEPSQDTQTPTAASGLAAPHGRSCRGKLLAFVGLSVGPLLLASAAFSQNLDTFLYRFSAGEPVSAQKINYNFDTLRASIVPVGAIMPFAGETVPRGWLLCDGGTIANGDYPELASVLGAAWGSAPGGTTRLPNLRGVFLRGAHDPGNFDPGGNRPVGHFQGEELGYHSHGVNGHAHNVNVGNVVTINYYAAVANGSTQARGVNDEGARTSTYSGSSTNAVGGESRPDNVAVNYIIHTGVLTAP